MLKLLFGITFSLIPVLIHAQTSIFFVGTANSKIENSIQICSFNQKTGELNILKEIKGGKGPGYLVRSENGKYLYTTSENMFNEKESSVQVFSISKNNWELVKINAQSSKGKHPCHISYDPKYKRIMTANYSSGSIAVHPVTKTGEIREAISNYKHTGSGPNKSRQEGPHAHYINCSADGKYVYSADLGIDKIMVYKTLKDGSIVPNQDFPFLKMEPGSGPRHLAFHKNGNFLFILNELSNEIVSCSYNSKDGSLHVLDKKSTLEPNHKKPTKAGAIRIHPNGKYLYCTNRGDNSIAVFKTDKEGKLDKIQTFRENVGVIRDFNMSKNGKFLIAGNQQEGEIIICEIAKDGILSPTSWKVELDAPSCIEIY